jgi:5-methylcytosine-specific restriction endonuclease McrA
MEDGVMARTLRSKKLRAALWMSAGGKCVICKTELPWPWHADHVEAWIKTGTTNVHDMQALCPQCNLKKGAK